MITVVMTLLYALEGGILTITAIVTGIKHSDFPDVRVGFHMRGAMESKEKWEDANETAGLVSGTCSVMFFAAAILVYWERLDSYNSIVLFFILSVITIGSVLILPVYLLKKSVRVRKRTKKILRNILIMFFTVAVVWSVWLYVYYHTKNADNLPKIQNLQADDKDGLVGYKRSQLISVWNQPDDTIGTNQDVWALDGDGYLLVTYGTGGKVKEAEFVIP